MLMPEILQVWDGCLVGASLACLHASFCSEPGQQRSQLFQQVINGVSLQGWPGLQARLMWLTIEEFSSEILLNTSHYHEDLATYGHVTWRNWSPNFKSLAFCRTGAWSRCSRLANIWVGSSLSWKWKRRCWLVKPRSPKSFLLYASSISLWSVQGERENYETAGGVFNDEHGLQMCRWHQISEMPFARDKKKLKQTSYIYSDIIIYIYIYKWIGLILC